MSRTERFRFSHTRQIDSAYRYVSAPLDAGVIMRTAQSANGRHVSLRGGRYSNFGSCSYTVPLDPCGLMCDPMCGPSHMATNLSLDPELLDKALRLSGEKTKRAAVDKALREFIARREQRELLGLFRKLDWDPDYDYKAARSRK